MKKDDLEPFSSVWGASGVQNFDGKGYWFHFWLRFLGLCFWGVTFVAKTTTWLARLSPEKKEGNMALKKDGMTPQERMPKCIYMSFGMWIKGMVLNAVGLSGPGAPALFQKGMWNNRKKAFMLSFMSVAETKEERLDELKKYLELLKSFLSIYRCPIALQLNYSCPNIGHALDKLSDEVIEGLDLVVASNINIPMIAKFNIELPIRSASKICNHVALSGICISNTIPFGRVFSVNWWDRHFPDGSPLKEFGGGGLSGAPLLPEVIFWIKRAREVGITCHINAGGGILGPIDAIKCLLAGADSISLGSIVLTRPWMMLLTVIATKVAKVFIKRK